MRPDALAALHGMAFPDAPWDAPAFEALLAQPSTRLFTTDHGFLLARFLPPEAEILTFAVTPAAQRQGIGQHLLGEMTRAAQDAAITALFLEVAADNIAARSLYTKEGFVQTAHRRAYYARENGPNADALILRRDLTQG